MNCKPGDLAVIVRSFIGNEGRIVRVLSLEGRATYANGTTSDNCWIVEGNLKTTGGPCPLSRMRVGDACVPDDCLRPIRDPGQDARDETLDWLPVPHKEIA